VSASAWLIVVAAGRGERLGAGTPKAFADLAGRPLFAYSLEAAAASDAFAKAVLVADPQLGWNPVAKLRPRARALMAGVVEGGATRRESVRAGLAAVRREVGAEADPVVLVHDAARPFAPPALFLRVATEALTGAVICAHPARDTMKEVRDDRVTATLPRRALWQAQTPQGASLSVFEKAHAAWPEPDSPDDAFLIEQLGAPVRVVPGPPINFKITTAEDLALAEAWARAGGVPWMAE